MIKIDEGRGEGGKSIAREGRLKIYLDHVSSNLIFRRYDSRSANTH